MSLRASAIEQITQVTLWCTVPGGWLSLWRILIIIFNAINITSLQMLVLLEQLTFVSAKSRAKKYKMLPERLCAYNILPSFPGENNNSCMNITRALVAHEFLARKTDFCSEELHGSDWMKWARLWKHEYIWALFSAPSVKWHMSNFQPDSFTFMEVKEFCSHQRIVSLRFSQCSRMGEEE